MLRCVDGVGRSSAEAVGKEIDQRTDVPKTIRGDAFTSLLGGFLGLPLMVTSGENIGIVRVIGVRSRCVTAASGVVLILIGFIAPVTRAISVVPSAVVGGTAMAVFAVITVLGGRGRPPLPLDTARRTRGATLARPRPRARGCPRR
ncbi:solute carrier family 23 protein [Streptomyces sp. NPDC051219]|uniref:solute carrier family 23 protein n=1 Tax=Streptomyces sp. NPDC051219 TaxID=3155283 RepID=UPI00342B0078